MAVVLGSGRYEARLYEDWCRTVSEKSQYNLSQPLLKRDPQTKQITVNFNPQVSQAAGIALWVPEGTPLTLADFQGKKSFLQECAEAAENFHPGSCPGVESCHTVFSRVV